MDPDATVYVVETSPRRVQSVSRSGTPPQFSADAEDFHISATRENVMSNDPLQVHRIDKGMSGDEKSLVVDSGGKRFNESRKVGLPSVLRNKAIVESRSDGCSRNRLFEAEAKVIRVAKRRLFSR
eukprot:GEMP01012370.1.p1 GENE.GEMP01012370.1~~GEMP01012370.1.p1  ORF type:complete len:125 (+),score=31.08 GEMP01012370.1:1287-1661(+)